MGGHPPRFVLVNPGTMVHHPSFARHHGQQRAPGDVFSAKIRHDIRLHFAVTRRHSDMGPTVPQYELSDNLVGRYFAVA